MYRTLLTGWGVTIPGGSCPEVGAGGHFAGGRYEPLSRRYGSVVDHLYGVEVVVVGHDGTARAVVATREPDDLHRDLWWAHTGGGGGNFGVVTRYWLRSPGATGGPSQLLPAAPRRMLQRGHLVLGARDRAGAHRAAARLRDRPRPRRTSGGVCVSRPIRLLIVDDHPVVRDGLSSMFVRDPEFEVLGEAADGAEAVRLAETLCPDVILMDLRMPGVDGVTATKELTGRARVLVLTTYDTDSHVVLAIEAGATGYLLKDAPRDELLRACAPRPGARRCSRRRWRPC